MADVFALADCFVFPSRAEGWGLPPREAAATGMPVIAPRHTGMIPGIDDWAAVVLEQFTRKPAWGLAKSVKGDWFEPDVDELAAAMRWCYDRRDEANMRGAAAACWLRANQTWDHAARDMIALLEQNL